MHDVGSDVVAKSGVWCGRMEDEMRRDEEMILNLIFQKRPLILRKKAMSNERRIIIGPKGKSISHVAKNKL